MRTVAEEKRLRLEVLTAGFLLLSAHFSWRSSGGFRGLGGLSVGHLPCISRFRARQSKPRLRSLFGLGLEGTHHCRFILRGARVSTLGSASSSKSQNSFEMSPASLATWLDPTHCLAASWRTRASATSSSDPTSTSSVLPWVTKLQKPK